MNYLRHLNGFFERLDEDKRLSSYHISLYLALFRQWNACRFSDRFVISRAETMELARIGSSNTYARCMKELTDWGYIRYKASSNLHCGSMVSCIRFDREADPATGIKTSIAPDTGSGATTDTSTSGNTESDTAGNITTDTGTKNDTASDTGTNPLGNTDTSGGSKSNTTTSTASDTGIVSGRRNDTATGAFNSDKVPAGIKSGTGADTTSDTLLINITKNNKQEENKEKKESPKEKEKLQKREPKENPQILQKEETEIPNLSEVVSFFGQNHFPQNEARQFYTRYLSTGWKTGNNQKIVSWQALARKWMTNNNKNNSHERPFNSIGAGRFSVPTDKDYSEPL